MDVYLLNELAGKIKIAPLNILREEAEMLVLQNIAESELSQKLIFYGGTALRLAYNCPRFSEDLDFLMVEPIKEAELEAVLAAVVSKDQGLKLVDLKEKRNTLFALLKLYHPSQKHPLSIKIEISKKKNGVKKEFLPLASPCSMLQPVIFAATLGSLEKTKLAALKARDFPRDWFDVYYIAKLKRVKFEPPMEFKHDKKEFIRELKRFLPKNHWPLIGELLKQL
ncbi:MAG: nucleotidyl transferase AbiEii/AbiGii toxin family protein [Candidatus Omnitrophota bacterium]